MEEEEKKHFYKQLGANIREFRQILGMSQEELAQHCGIKVKRLKLIETGAAKRVDITRFLMLAWKYKISFAKLLDID